ncbi:hypothetical protein Poli38472_001975 [Pythium oligandrum]|uniref:Uncharacterized protein n=1 Tax=Pythium oligandrum TaxID=41045 RepID=A0A8K1CUL0_PYTOL|nr:hypothetical protein Poli38472_001975 [Pythium oligandrum]|eukprot:TMW69819.1 hypothetical protein Poli38472_001975 [Pythium oligandrum]
MTSPTLQQRWERFLSEDAGTLAFSTVLLSGFVFAKELHGPHLPESTSFAHRAQRAMLAAMPKVPMVVASSAVGIIGMNMMISAVMDARRDYTRSSVKIALPLFAALMHAPRGPRSMAKSAVGYGAFIFGADYVFEKMHRREALLMETPPHHHHDHVFAHHGYFPEPVVHNDHGAPLRLE